MRWPWQADPYDERADEVIRKLDEARVAVEQAAEEFYEAVETREAKDG